MSKRFTLFAFLFMLPMVAMAQPYIITAVLSPGETTFKVVKDSETVADQLTGIGDVISTIKNDAGGTDCEIQFGEGEEINVGATGIIFEGVGWGKITLNGKIASSASNAITLNDDVSVESNADIRRTVISGNAAIRNNSTGTLTISGGTIDPFETNDAIDSRSGVLEIKGGTISSAFRAIYSTYSKIIISGNANIVATSSNANSGAAIFITSSDNISPDEILLEIKGGTIKNTGKGAAIYNNSYGAIKISDGLVSSVNLNTTYSDTINGTVYIAPGRGALEITGGTIMNTAGDAIHSRATAAKVNINGGKISAGRWAIYNRSSGTVNINDGEISAAGTGSYAVYNPSSGVININGGKISTTTTTAVYNNSASGTVNINGGTISSTTGVAVRNSYPGKITISGDAIITSRNTSDTSGTITIKYTNSTTTTTPLEITGGTIENTATGGNAIYWSATAPEIPIWFGGNPAITGNIRKAAGAGNLGLIITGEKEFAPQEGREYTLDFAAYSSGSMAVVQGKNFLDYFTTVNDNWSIVESGNNLVLERNPSSSSSEETQSSSSSSETQSSSSSSETQSSSSSSETQSSSSSSETQSSSSNNGTQSSSSSNGTQSSSSSNGTQSSSSSGAETSSSSSDNGTPEPSSSSGTTIVIQSSSSSDGASPVIISRIASGQTIIQATSNAILLENLPNNAKVQIYNLKGRRIYSNNNHENPKILKIMVQTKGLYIIKINNAVSRVVVR